MSEDALMARAKAFFEGKSKGGTKLKGDEDPELQTFLKSLEKQVKAAQNDKDFKASLVRTLAVLEREIRSRRDAATPGIVNAAAASGQRLSGDEVAAQALRAVPRELRYLQSSGLALVAALNGNSKMTEKELRKFSDRSSAFAAGIDKLRTSGPKGADYAQERGAGGMSLTERLQQHREGQLMDTKRHEELLKKLDETADRGDKRSKETSDATKLGLTALFGPAAPLFQLWFDAKEDWKRMRGDTKSTLDTLKSKFRWDRAEAEDEKKYERRKTSLWERMLGALRRQSQGESGRGMLGSLFGDGPGRGRIGRIARGAGRVLGRTVRGAGRLLGAGGRGLAAIGRGAVGLAGRGLAGIAASGAGALAGAATAVAGAGYAGYKAGEWLNDNVLTDEQKEAIGNAIGPAIDYIIDGGKSVGSALASAGSNIAGFFDKVGSNIGIGLFNVKEELGKKLDDAGTTVKKWSDDAKTNLADFWDAFKSRATNNPVVNNVRDFFNPQAGGNKLDPSQMSMGERARSAVSNLVDRGASFFGGGSGGRMQEALEAQMTRSGITDPRERAMMLAQMSHESSGFKSGEESFNYRDADRLASVSGQARKAGPAAIQAAMAKGPEAIAELMYGGRMGNVDPGDAYKFRGRGVIQLTGRENYEKYGKKLGIDLLSNPELAKDPEIAAKIATQYWQDRNLGSAARAGDVTAVTRGINGGTNGLADRQARYDYYMKQQGAGPANAFATSTAGAGRAGFAGTALDPRRTDYAAARPAGVPGYERAAANSGSPVVVQPPAPAAGSGGATTSSANKVGMSNSDFYVDDLGLIIMNRGYNG